MSGGLGSIRGNSPRNNGSIIDQSFILSVNNNSSPANKKQLVKDTSALYLNQSMVMIEESAIERQNTTENNK